MEDLLRERAVEDVVTMIPLVNLFKLDVDCLDPLSESGFVEVVGQTPNCDLLLVNSMGATLRSAPRLGGAAAAAFPLGLFLSEPSPLGLFLSEPGPAFAPTSSAASAAASCSFRSAASK